MLTPNELVFTFGGSYLCAIFDKNRTRIECDRESAHRRIHTLIDAHRFLICPMLHAK